MEQTMTGSFLQWSDAVIQTTQQFRTALGQRSIRGAANGSDARSEQSNVDGKINIEVWLSKSKVVIRLGMISHTIHL